MVSRERERKGESVYLLCHQCHQMVLMQGGILRECFLFFSVERSFSPDIFHLLCWECFTKAEWGGHFWWWRCQARDIEIVCRNVTAWFDRWKYQSSYRTCLQLAFGKVFQRQWLSVLVLANHSNGINCLYQEVKFDNPHTFGGGDKLLYLRVQIHVSAHFMKAFLCFTCTHFNFWVYWQFLRFR